MTSANSSAGDAKPALRIAQLEVQIGPRKLCIDRPCHLRAGRLYLLVGRSGSGKSSFARALLGFGHLSDPPIHCRGDVEIRDAAGSLYPLWTQDDLDSATRRQIAFLPQSERLGFLDGLSLADNLTLFSQLSERDATEGIARLAEQFHISPLPTALASASGGERIRLSAIRGLLPRDSSGRPPAVVIADEPTAGLDPRAAESLARTFQELVAGRQAVVIVITHEPELFLEDRVDAGWREDPAVQIVECPSPDDSGDSAPVVIGRLHWVPSPQPRDVSALWVSRAGQWLSRLGAVALAPVAFVSGLTGLHRPAALLWKVIRDVSGPGTQVFSLVGCLLVAGTVAYFIFERMPKPELVEPLLLPEIFAVTGHALVRVVLPLTACSLVTAKLGAAQAARLAAAVRGGLLETLALAGWRVEGFALLPAVVAQILAMAVATLLALAGGVILAGIVYVAGHADASLPLAISLLVDGMESAPTWFQFATAKVILSGFLGGTIAALSGIAPSRAEDDVARAVHNTLLWSVLAVIACQCLLVLVEFAK
ncbi:MAG: ATP-binding cassette domain-containing protein [Pirellulaceae bacterium]